MNKVNIVTVILRRMYRTKRRRELSGIRSKIKLIENSESINLEEFDDDINEYEADFFNVAKNHKMHEREMELKKTRLKQDMVKKYFEEKEPRFLTFAEKELIRNLHELDPEEWPVERLSESFPVLPETIHKILHAKWSPKSVERVMQYDKVVMENWKNFHAGKLAVNPILNKHLMKFKERKIILTDRELLAKKFVAPKPIFKKPTSQLFSNIIKNHVNKQQDNIKLLSQKDNPNKVVYKMNNSSKNQNLSIINTSSEYSSIAIDSLPKFLINKKGNLMSQSETNLKRNDMPNSNNVDKIKNTQQPLTFNEFVKIRLNNGSKMSSEEIVTLLNIRRAQMNASQEMQNTEVTTVYDKAMIKSMHNPAPVKNEDNDSDVVSADDNLTDTCIKIWNKKVDNECDYMKPIKIAKNIYKAGMTYRISDCYYDDDGEFLYRVPGLQN